MNEAIQLSTVQSLELGVIVLIRFQCLNPIKLTHSDSPQQALVRSMRWQKESMHFIERVYRQGG
jgi:hypothetical protein